MKQIEKKVEVRDLLDYRLIHDAALVGKQLLCVETRMDEKKNCYCHNLMCMDPETGALKALTHDNKVGSFLPEDDTQVLFAACRSEEDKPEYAKKKTVWYRLSLAGGEAEKAFEAPFQVTDMKQIPGTDFALLSCLENLYELDPETASKEEIEDAKDYIELHEIPFVANGLGYIDSERVFLVLLNIKTGETTRITERGFQTEGAVLSGRKIIYKGKNWKDVCPEFSGLYCYDIDSGETVCLLSDDRLSIRQMAADAENLYFMATDMIPYGCTTTADFYHMDSKTGKVELICENEFSVGSHLTTDVAYGGGDTFRIFDGVLYFVQTVGYYAEIYALIEGKPVKQVPFKGSVTGFIPTREGIYFTGMEEGKLQEIYFADPTGEVKQCTHISEECLAGKQIQPVEYAGFTNRAGMTIDGWVIRPAGYEEGKKYPAILDIHGGPRITYGTVLFHEMQVWASEGYFVFFCNPRGSDGYGDDFADMRLRYGTIDYDDIMDFTDHVQKVYPDIDEHRMGVTGGSYGGFMTNWIITHTHRFAAAATQRSISDWISDYGTSGISYDDDLHGGAKPWDQVEKMWDHSPLKTADYCKTPTLFIHSFEDYICAISQAMELFTAFKVLGVETKACLFKGENHSLSRVGLPRHRFKRLNEITGWMNGHLK